MAAAPPPGRPEGERKKLVIFGTQTPVFVGTLLFHCVAHKHQLGVSEAAEGVLYLAEFESVLNAVYTHFARSAQRKDECTRVFQFLDEVMHALVHWNKTRWLSRTGAMDSAFHDWRGLVHYFKVRIKNDAVAQMLHHGKLTSFKFYASLCFMHDVLSKQSVLSLMFHQKDDDLDFGAVRDLVNATIDGLKRSWLDEEPTLGVQFRELYSCVPETVDGKKKDRCQVQLFDDKETAVDFTRAKHEPRGCP